MEDIHDLFLPHCTQRLWQWSTSGEISSERFPWWQEQLPWWRGEYNSQELDNLFHPLVRISLREVDVEPILPLEASLFHMALVALTALMRCMVALVEVPRVVGDRLRARLRDGGGGEVVRVGGECLGVSGGVGGGGQGGRGGWGKVKAGSRKQRNGLVHHQDPPTATTTTTTTTAAATSLKNILRKMRKMHFWLITTTFAFKNL